VPEPVTPESAPATAPEKAKEVVELVSSESAIPHQKPKAGDDKVERKEKQPIAPAKAEPTDVAEERASRMKQGTAEAEGHAGDDDFVDAMATKQSAASSSSSSSAALLSVKSESEKESKDGIKKIGVDRKRAGKPAGKRPPRTNYGSATLRRFVQTDILRRVAPQQESAAAAAAASETVATDGQKTKKPRRKVACTRIKAECFQPLMSLLEHEAVKLLHYAILNAVEVNGRRKLKPIDVQVARLFLKYNNVM
jgi:hypothetical protein